MAVPKVQEGPNAGAQAATVWMRSSSPTPEAVDGVTRGSQEQGRNALTAERVHRL